MEKDKTMEQKINEVINNMPNRDVVKDFSLQTDSNNCINLTITIQIYNLTSNFKIKQYAISSKSDKNLIVNTEFKFEKDYDQKSNQMELYYTLPLQNIDTKTLKYIPATLEKYYCRGNLFHKYYADKNGFYYIDFTKKPYILKLKTNELTNLMVFDDIFAKTEKEVFFMGKRVSGINAQTFKPVYNDTQPWWLEYTDDKYLIQNENCYRCNKIRVGGKSAKTSLSYRELKEVKTNH